MGTRIPLPEVSTTLVLLGHPTDVFLKNPLDNTNDSATSSFKVYVPSKDEVLSAAEATGQTVFSMTNPGAFVIGDTLELTLDDASLHSSLINAVDTVAGTVTVNDVTPSAAAKGNRGRVRLGPEISMTEFGTAVLGADDFGFAGSLIPSSHPVLSIGLEVNAEILFLGGAGLTLLETICYVVKRDCDCG